MRFHFRQKFHFCTVNGCNLGFTRPRHLIHHFRWHRENRACVSAVEAGGRNGVNTGGGRSHQYVDRQEQAWVCGAEGCERSFDRNADLYAHWQEHLGFRSYACLVEGCNKWF
ncbi:MAG: C2H2-type zinc finger protein, partial [Kistimonas sp.]|nr:C2H2-type zinc finger protein [Kistimonas sp.]